MNQIIWIEINYDVTFLFIEWRKEILIDQKKTKKNDNFSNHESIEHEKIRWFFDYNNWLKTTNKFFYFNRYKTFQIH